MTLAFKDTVLTNKGFNISNKAALGKAQFSIVKAVSTDYDLTNYKIEDLKNLTSLPNEIYSGTLSDYDSPENSISVIKLNFDNSKFKQGYTIRAIGLYGRDSDNNTFLHSLTISDTPILIPEVSGNIFDGLNHSITIFSGDNQKMNVDIEQQGAASIHYVNQAISNLSGQIKDDIKPTLNKKVEQSDLDNLENKINESSYKQKQQLDDDIEQKADSSVVQRLNDNLSIKNGRNLLLNTWSGLKSLNGNNNYFHFSQAENLQGKTVTISYDYHFDTENNSRAWFEHMNQSNNWSDNYWFKGIYTGKSNDTDTNNGSIPLTSHSSFTFTFTGSSDTQAFMNFIPNGMSIGNVKLELGENATSWAPAPEDLARNIDVQENFNKCNDQINTLSNKNTDVTNQINDLTDKSSKQFTQLNQNIEDAENRMNRNIENRLQFFNSISDLNNSNAPEGTIAIVKGG